MTMIKITTILSIATYFIMLGCSSGKNLSKGFPVASTSENTQNSKTEGLNKDSLKFETRPSNVLLTGIQHVRLTTIYKINYNKDNSGFIGTNYYYYNYEESVRNQIGNNWNNHIIPGFEALYGYNLVNVSHYDITENKQILFFDKPVLIKTLYYPSFSNDTLNNKPVNRNFFMISVYNEDTNKDGFINLKDLRRFYLYNIKGERQKALIPENYSVFKSEYDSDNDFLYVFAQLDDNNNGKRDEGEPIHVFWIDLKDTNKTGRQY